ncbi:MAG: hypothetical protein HRU24_05955 [Gammaproteobacteria bacterium]|nr:hypothetical protein [Gammaproteobacteria bacterium]
MTLLLCVISLSMPVKASDGIYWMNSWDPACYENNTNTCRENWYTLAQGSHLIRWEVFKTLESEDSEQLFSARYSLSQYGFLYPEADNYYEATAVYDGSAGERVEQYVSNHQLPIGMVKDQRKDKGQLFYRSYMGLTCAGCHTGKVTYGANTYYVEGGQANVDMFKFLQQLKAALLATKNNPEKFARFKTRFAQYVSLNFDVTAPVSLLAAQKHLDQSIKYVSDYVATTHSSIVNGPTRLDAIGAILNKLHYGHTGQDISQAPLLTAPVTYPYIWDATSLECIQTNCVGFDPLTRNSGEVLGVFGYINLDQDENIPDILELVTQQLGLSFLFEATPKVRNLVELEVAINRANSPKWPATFPALDTALIAQGKTLYSTNCASCHMDTSDGVDQFELTEPNSIGRRFTKVIRVPYDVVGTDEAFAVDYGMRQDKTGILGAVIKQRAGDTIDPATGLSFNEVIPESFSGLALLGVATNIVINNHERTLDFRDQATQTYPNLSVDDAKAALHLDNIAGHTDRPAFVATDYRAKPLNGIAFTGPFLHNGSVRTLKDLLKAPQNRPTSFLIGSTEYDVGGAGYVNAGSFLLDTTIRGNGKEGHTYGTQLSASDKLALLEYMKSM